MSCLVPILLLLLPDGVLASTGVEAGGLLDLTATGFGYAALIVFIISYGFVIGEEFLHLRKSKPVLLAAGVIWAIVGLAYSLQGDTEAAAAAFRHHLVDYAELLLFLLAAMTYVNTMEERNIFHLIRARLVSSGLSLKGVFWITGFLAFFISPFADNLTTALVMAAVVLAIGEGRPGFIGPACVNIVVAANAGGAFSPFGDITTLMVWQKGLVTFFEFFALFIPALVNWLVPAAIMSFFISAEKPTPHREAARLKSGAVVIVGLFLTTIAFTVALHSLLHMPPVLGMMTGLGALKLYGYFIRREEIGTFNPDDSDSAAALNLDDETAERIRRFYKPKRRPFDVFISMKRIEWDTLMFFYGVILCVGGLGTIGYLALLSGWIYDGLGPTTANVLVGIVSAVVDNIPIMFAVLSMNPEMSLGQWLLVTLTAGVGGSLLSIGSAAGVALMGQARGAYTFFSHLRWAWAIALGYALSIWAHFLINARLM